MLCILLRMVRNVATGFIWFWGLWTAGSLVEFIGLMPVWPLFLVGVVGGIYLALGRPTLTRTGTPAESPQPSR